VTWLEGHSLAQTVFTNLYLHDPNLIEDRPLKAFSVCMLKTVDLIKDRINRAGVYEEVQYSKFWILFSFVNCFEFTTTHQFVFSTTCIHQVYEEVISVSGKIII